MICSCLDWEGDPLVSYQLSCIACFILQTCWSLVFFCADPLLASSRAIFFVWCIFFACFLLQLSCQFDLVQSCFCCYWCYVFWMQCSCSTWVSYSLANSLLCVVFFYLCMFCACSCWFSVQFLSVPPLAGNLGSFSSSQVLLDAIDVAGFLFNVWLVPAVVGLLLAGL